MKSRSSRLTLTGSRAWGRWPDPSSDRERAVRELREPCTGGAGAHGVVASVDDEHRAIDAGEQFAHALLVLEPGCELGRDERLGVRLEAPADAVLALLRRVRLGEALREEELEEVLVALEPVVAVPLVPADVLLARLAELLHRLQPRGRRRQRQGWGDEHQLGDALGVARREVQRPLRAARERHQHRLLGAGRIHDGERIGGELLLAIRVGPEWPVRAAVAAAVERQHSAMPREVGNLHLPVARVDDRPGRHEQHRRLAGAVDLVEEAHAVALDAALLVGVAGPRLRPRGRPLQRDGHCVLPSSQASIHSRSSRCSISIPDSRSSMIPSLNV